MRQSLLVPRRGHATLRTGSAPHLSAVALETQVSTGRSHFDNRLDVHHFRPVHRLSVFDSHETNSVSI